MQTKIQVLSPKKKISYSCRVKSHTYIRYSAKWFGNKNVVMAHICKHWMYNSCFSASLRFPACKCSLCDSWYYSCVQRRLGKADTGAFQNNRCVDGTDLMCKISIWMRDGGSVCVSERLCSVWEGGDGNRPSAALASFDGLVWGARRRGWGQPIRSHDSTSQGGVRLRLFLAGLGTGLRYLKGSPGLVSKVKKGDAVCAQGNYLIYILTVVLPQGHTQSVYSLFRHWK